MVLAWVAIFGIVFMLVHLPRRIFGARREAARGGDRRADRGRRGRCGSRCATTAISGSMPASTAIDAPFLVDSGASITTHVARDAPKRPGSSPECALRRSKPPTARCRWRSPGPSGSKSAAIARSDFTIHINDHDQHQCAGDEFPVVARQLAGRGQLSGARAVTNDIQLGGLYILMAIMLVVGIADRRAAARSPGLATMALAWVAIFGAGFVLFTFRDDLGFVAQRLKTEATGAPIVAGREVRIPMAIDGHFWVEGQINGAPVQVPGRQRRDDDDHRPRNGAADRRDDRRATRDQMVRTGNGIIRCRDGRAQSFDDRRDRARQCRAAHRRGRRIERAGHEFPVVAQAVGRRRAMADPSSLSSDPISMFYIIHIIILASRERMIMEMRPPDMPDGEIDKPGHDDALARLVAIMARLRDPVTRLRMGQRADLRDDRALHDRGSL